MASTEPKPSLKTDNKGLLALFWDLVSFDEDDRVQSTVKLIKLLKSAEKTDIDYSIQRLVKGLGSSRKAARQGYATALTHTLTEHPQVQLDSVLTLVDKNLTTKSSSKAQEEKDAHFGMVFALLALNRVNNCNADKRDKELTLKITERLLTLSKKKSYLAEVCTKAVCDIISTLDYVEFDESYSALLKEIYAKGWEKCSPENLLLAYTVQTAFKGQIENSVFEEAWGKSTLTHHKTFESLSKVLMESTNNSHPKIHVVVSTILCKMISSKHFRTFWKLLVEDNLLHSTHERKFLAINLLVKVAPTLSQNQVDTVFSESILRCLINSRQSKENYLDNAVSNVLQQIPAVLNKECIIPLLKRVQGRYGHICFDAMTKSKFVEQLVTKVTGEDVEKLIEWLQSSFLTGCVYESTDRKKVTEKEAKLCRAWVCNMLCAIIRSNKSILNDNIILETANFLFLHSYFTVLQTNQDLQIMTVAEPTLCEDTRKVCEQRFNSVLTDLIHYHHLKEDGKPKFALGGVDKLGDFFATQILNYAKQLVSTPKFVQLNEAWTPEMFESFSQNMEMISKLATEKADDVMQTKGVELLFANTTLQLFSKHRDEAVSVLQELKMCYEKSQENKKKKRKEPHWSEVLTEILLGFLAQPSNLLRHVVDAVFPSITPHLTQEAFDLLISAIKPKAKGESDLLEEEEEMETNDGDENTNAGENGIDSKDDKNEDNSKEENEEDGENDKNSSEDEKSLEDENSSDESDNSESDADEEIDEEFKANVKQALGDCAAKDDDDDDSGEESDIDMDTCDVKLMQTMDAALAQVFRSKRQKENQKKEKHRNKTTVLHFKMRVLDLVEIFIKKQPRDPKLLQLVESLLDVLQQTRASEEQHLFERCVGIYKNKLCNLHQYPPRPDPEQVHDVIERFIRRAKSASSVLVVTYITHGLTYLIRVLRGVVDLKEPSPRRTRSQRSKTPAKTTTKQKESCLDASRLLAAYKDALEDFMSKRNSHLHAILFTELFQRFPDLGWQLAEVLPQYINTGCNNFRKVKACEMLKVLISKKVPEEYIEKLKEPFLSNIEKLLTNISTCGLKARQIHDVIHLSDQFTKNLVKQEKTQVDFTPLHDSLRSAMESEVMKRSPSLVAYCKSYLNALENRHESKQPAKKKKKD